MFKPACLAVLLVVLAISSCYADPTCGSVNIVNQGGFAARFKTKTGGKETDWSDTVTAGVSRGWGTDQLKAAGEGAELKPPARQASTLCCPSHSSQLLLSSTQCSVSDGICLQLHPVHYAACMGETLTQFHVKGAAGLGWGCFWVNAVVSAVPWHVAMLHVMLWLAAAQIHP